MIRYDRRSIALAVALSTLAGYVDATGFLATGGFFVSFISGNPTRLGIGLGEVRFGYAVLASGVVVLFVAGVVLGSLVARRARRRRRPAVLRLVAALLALAALGQTLQVGRLGTAAVLLAMGAENATFQREGEVTIGLTYRTGTLVGPGTPYAGLWLGLVAGAATSALVHARLGPYALWPAALAALGLAAASARTRLRYR